MACRFDTSSLGEAPVMKSCHVWPGHEQPLVSCKVPKQKTSLDTDLFFYQVENELQAELTYNADVFAEDTANRFAESLQVTGMPPS